MWNLQSKRKVAVNGQKMTLAQYASRMNIKMLRPVDFNKKLRINLVP